ncbi:hypothetical protein SAY86_021117 [Trapa natans]|uniref:Uncharacterized protein n=1 Tax=Trapa natans TaxID=22666 RepID=A0AAN7RFE8_TRANT|nr:hypothetical protein SAY86_021117 [Trapa natans]
MDPHPRFLLAIFIVFAAAVSGVRGSALVAGSVFCDHCRDGKISIFDYPLGGIRLAFSCNDGDGRTTMSKEITTNILGGYAVMFEGTPDLAGCRVQVITGQEGSCTAVPGPGRSIELSTQFWDFSTYMVDPLFSSPAKLPSFCPQPSSPNPSPREAPLWPPVKLPPALPPSKPRTVPFLEASACPYSIWMRPEYACHWRLVNPDTKVALVFGLMAARTYGTDMTLSQALQGRGEAYRTLLREATAALLNSYNSIQFPYHPARVFLEMNSALEGSEQRVLRTALNFMRANSGNGKGVQCTLTACN